MIREDIVGGLKNALSRGQTLEQAMMSFYNSGYKKEDIEESARYLYMNKYSSNQVQPSPQSQNNIQQTTKPLPQQTQNNIQQTTKPLPQQTQNNIQQTTKPLPQQEFQPNPNSQIYKSVIPQPPIQNNIQQTTPFQDFSPQNNQDSTKLSFDFEQPVIYPQINQNNQPKVVQRVSEYIPTKKKNTFNTIIIFILSLLLLGLIGFLIAMIIFKQETTNLIEKLFQLALSLI